MTQKRTITIVFIVFFDYFNESTIRFRNVSKNVFNSLKFKLKGIIA